MSYATAFALLISFALVGSIVVAGMTARFLATRLPQWALGLGSLAGCVALAVYPFVLFGIVLPNVWFGGNESMFGFELLLVCWFLALVSPVATWPINRRLLRRWQCQ